MFSQPEGFEYFTSNPTSAPSFVGISWACPCPGCLSICPSSPPVGRLLGLHLLMRTWVTWGALGLTGGAPGNPPAHLLNNVDHEEATQHPDLCKGPALGWYTDKGKVILQQIPCLQADHGLCCTVGKGSPGISFNFSRSYS